MCIIQPLFSPIFLFSFVHFRPCCWCCCCTCEKCCTQHERRGCETRDGLWCGCARSKCQVDDDKWPAVADKLAIVRRPDVPEPHRSSVLQARHSLQGPFLSRIYLYCCMFVYICGCIYTNMFVCTYTYIHTCMHTNCTYTRVFTCTHTDTRRCLSASPWLCLSSVRSSDRLSSRAALCLRGGSGVFYSCRYRYHSPRTLESNTADHSVSQPTRRRRRFVFFPPQRHLMSQIATGWVFIATCGSFWVCRSRSPKVNLPAWLPGACLQLSLCRNTDWD